MRTRRYSLVWDDMDDLQIEMACVRKGGKWKMADGKEYGEGLFSHFKKMQSLLWPDDDHHLWSDLILKTILENRMTVVQGSRDSSKTRTMSKYALSDYWCYPNETLILMSSTDIRGLELRVWGDIKDLFDRARELWPWLAGNVVDAKHGVFTDALGEDAEVRDMRRGILCIPCLGSDGQWAGGLEKFCGIKQKRRRLLGDELQFMHINYINVLSNLDKGDFKGCFVGNPIGGNGKALDKIAEPIAGWDSLGEITKTITWPNRYEGITINLVGIDSPNFQPDRPKNYSYLVDQADVDRVLKRSGKDSAEFWSQIMGVRKIGVDNYRVLTRGMCLKFGAFDKCIWSGSETTKVLGIDAGYGGDPCECIPIEFGAEVTGQTVVKFNPVITIPIMLSSTDTAEDQIAIFVKSLLPQLGITPANVFFEAGMRASLAISMARIVGNEVNAVNAGGAATDRPVCNDMFIFDERTKIRRLKKCSEHYSKFITETWFQVRQAVESYQVREMPEDVVNEFGMREWHWTNGNRYELETKQECKLRMGSSPNRADCTSISLEGARRLGFVIERMRADENSAIQDNGWLDKEISKQRKLNKKYTLTYS